MAEFFVYSGIVVVSSLVDISDYFFSGASCRTHVNKHLSRQYSSLTEAKETMEIE